jgi:hypothetical protein
LPNIDKDYQAIQPALQGASRHHNKQYVVIQYVVIQSKIDGLAGTKKKPWKFQGF